MVLDAVHNYGWALYSASIELRSDPETILTATKNNPEALLFAMGDILSCTTGESIEFVETLLQTLLEDKEGATLWSLSMDVLPELKAVLIGLSQKLKAVDDFTICGDATPDVLARRWIARLQETHWCLARVCQNAGVSIDAQQTMEQYTTLARDSETAKQFWTYSNIISMSMELFGRNVDDDSNWWDLLSDLETNHNENIGRSWKRSSSLCMHLAFYRVVSNTNAVFDKRGVP